MQGKNIRLLFVCMGNICRSPAGENVMRHVLEREGLAEHFTLDSVGTIGSHAGHAPDQRMRDAARKRGIPMTGRARQVTGADMRDFDWILAMDEDNFRDLKVLERRTPGATARIGKFCDFCENHEERDVPDPYYGGPAGFEKVLDLLEDGCESLVRRYREGRLE